MLKNTLTLALRNIKKHKGFSFILVTGLAVGMACCLLMALFIQDELSYDTYHKNANRIYRIIKQTTSKGTTSSSTTTPPPLAPALIQDFPEVENVVRFMETPYKEVLLGCQDKQFYENRFFFADAAVFEVFSFPLVKGDPKHALREPYTLVLTQKMARKYFGSQNPIGKVITFNNKDDYRVTGVLENIPSQSHFHFDFLASFATLNHYFLLPLDDWGSCALYSYLLLSENFSYLDLEKKFPAFITKHGGSGTFIEGLYLQPLTTIHLHSHISGEIEANSDSAFIYVFSAIAAVILLIACFNFVNLATAQHLKRAREIGMRKVLGARKEQIVKQYLGEGVVLTFLSLPFVFVLVELFLPVFNRIVKKNLSVGYFDNAFFLFGIIGIAFFVGVIASVYPGMFLASFHPLRALRGGRSVSARSSFRNVLVLVQFSLSVLLIISTLVIHHQLRFIRNKKLGLNQDHVVVLPVKQRQDLVRFQSLKNEWLRDPHILKVAFSSDVPGRTSVNGNPFIPEGFDSDSRLTIDNMRVDYDFLPTLGITLKQGRNFSRDFAMDESRAFILNESAVEKIGWESPVGKQIVWRGGPGKIKRGRVIGVVENFHYKSLHSQIEPLVLHIWPRSFDNILMRIRSEDTKNTLAKIQQIWQELSPRFPFVYSFLNEDFDRLYKAEERLGEIFVYFSFLSISVACLGLFGLASFAAEQRTKEVGIRKVLGASLGNISALLMKDFAKWVLIANVFAWPLAYMAMSRWLQNFAYRINLGVWIFLLAAVLSSGIALTTVGLKAVKTALTDPVDSLRTE